MIQHLNDRPCGAKRSVEIVTELINKGGEMMVWILLEK